ncbi:MAG: sensor histidine kinase [Thalassobius sp.]|nr:sensor histidine kinase [Thalassovita sp.]
MNEQTVSQHQASIATVCSSGPIKKVFLNRIMLCVSKYFHWFLVLFLFFSQSTVQAQNMTTDSLKTALKNHIGNDSTRVMLLYYLAFTYFRTDIEISNNYLQKADDLSDSLNFIGGKARVLYLKGIQENTKSEYGKSLDYFERSLDYYKSINHKAGIASIYTAFGITHNDLSQYDEAIEAYKKASEIYAILKDTTELITCLINSGNTYSESGNFNDAISNYMQALKLSEDSRDEDGISYVHTNLGVVYKKQGNYPLAIEYLNKALDFDKKTDDLLGLALKLHDLGEVYNFLKDNKKSLSYHEQSLDYATKIGNKRLIAINEASIGNIFKDEKEYAKALENYQRSLEISRQIENLRQTAICYNNIAEVNLLLDDPLQARKNFMEARDICIKTNNGDILPSCLLGIAETNVYEKKYQEALVFVNEGKQIAEELNLLEIQKKAAELHSVIYENKQLYKKALESHQRFKVLNDSLFNKENVKKITQIEYEYKYKQALDSASIRELELTKTVMDTSHDLAKSRQKYLWAIIGILIISIVSGSMVFYQKFNNIKVKTESIVTEQKLLRSQMTPHFVFNSLSVLQGMILNKEEKKSVTYLSKFSRLLRITLENSRDKIVLLSQELTAVENYMALQNLENDDYEFSISIDNGIDGSLFKIPPMIIQPFIENAIEHAFAKQAKDKKIEMHLKYFNQELICIIKDNGIGINSQKGKNGNGKKSLATQITSERLKILSTYFKMKGSVAIEDRSKYDEKGTVVTLVLPHEKLEIL